MYSKISVTMRLKQWLPFQLAFHNVGSCRRRNCEPLRVPKLSKLLKRTFSSRSGLVLSSANFYEGCVVVPTVTTKVIPHYE